MNVRPLGLSGEEFPTCIGAVHTTMKLPTPVLLMTLLSRGVTFSLRDIRSNFNNR